MGEIISEKFSEKAMFIYPKGYVDKIFGEKIFEKVMEISGQGFRTVVLSFRDCPIINSLGNANLIEIIDFASKKPLELWFADLSKLHKNTFEAAGMLMFIPKVVTTEEAKKLLQEKQ